MEPTPRQADAETAGSAEPAPPPAARRRWLAAARLAVLAVALGLIAWYVWRNADDFRGLGKLSPASVAAALGLDAMLYVYGAAAIILAVHLFGPRLAPGEAVLLALMTRFGNLLLPLRGGAVARALYLNKRHGLSYAHFLAGLSAMLLAMLAACLGLALVGLIAIGLATGRFFPCVTALLAAILAGAAMTVMLRPRKRDQAPFPGPGQNPDEQATPQREKVAEPFSLRWVRAQGRRLLDGYHLVSRNKPVLLGLLATSSLHVATLAGVYAVLLAGMAKPADLGLLVVVVAIVNVSNILHITPGNVGVYEGLLAILGSLMGLEVADLLAAGLTARVLDTALILAVGPVSSYLLTGKAFGQKR